MASIKYFHTMIRVSDPIATIAFFNLIGLQEVRRISNDRDRFSLIFLAAPGDEDVAQLELTHNWDEANYSSGRNFGHLAFYVDSIYATCHKLIDAGIVINRPPRDGFMAFVQTPDGISVELLQREASEPCEPWMSMPNTGSW